MLSQEPREFEQDELVSGSAAAQGSVPKETPGLQD